MASRSLVLANAATGGAFPSAEEDMTADEVTFWQHQAALLDPLAYDWTIGDGSTFTFDDPGYVVNAFWIEASSGHWFHRQADVAQAMPVAAGRTMTLGTGAFTPFLYTCTPQTVIDSDARYGTDARGLYFERLARLTSGELPQYTIGGANTGSSMSVQTFPGDFTYGLIVGASSMHVAWTILLIGAETAGMNTLNEISNTDGIAFAERCLFPFTRATFPKTAIQGVSDMEGNGVLTYYKLPGDW